MTSPIAGPSARTQAAADAISLVQAFFTDAASRRRYAANACDFTFGNPHEMPLPGLVAALQRCSVPQAVDWFGYKASEPGAQRVVAQSLSERHGLAFEPADIALTNGGFAAIAVALRLLTDAGDEIIYSLPPWFCYEPMIRGVDGAPVKVPLRRSDFDLDLAAIETAITPRTRLVIVNTPHNPTGRIYSPTTLQELAGVLERASVRQGRRIFLLSDEPYNRIVYTGQWFTSPVAYYPWTLIAYSYGKVLLAPGERIGYLALSPDMPDRDFLRSRLFAAQMACGWAFPNATLQHAIAELEGLSIDIGALQRKRDRMVLALRGIGYDLNVPEGTFYLLPKSPLTDDVAFSQSLAGRDVFVMPGRLLEIPGYFRICLTSTEDMIERSLPAFEAAYREAMTAALLR
jgi:aspartate aminotransferase